MHKYGYLLIKISLAENNKIILHFFVVYPTSNFFNNVHKRSKSYLNGLETIYEGVVLSLEVILLIDYDYWLCLNFWC